MLYFRALVRLILGLSLSLEIPLNLFAPTFPVSEMEVLVDILLT